MLYMVGWSYDRVHRCKGGSRKKVFKASLAPCGILPIHGVEHTEITLHTLHMVHTTYNMRRFKMKSDVEMKRKESMVPVQGRVSIMTLAELDEYWKAHGVSIGSMSQLIGWSLELFRELLQVNGRLERVIERVDEAHRHLSERGLYQTALRKRGSKKIMHAMMFENLRDEGVEPSEYASRQHQMVHKSGTTRLPKKDERPDINELVDLYEKIGKDES